MVVTGNHGKTNQRITEEPDNHADADKLGVLRGIEALARSEDTHDNRSDEKYGIGDHVATGIDLYTGPDCAYWGALIRYGLNVSKWFNIGTEVIPSFNLNNNFRFSYLTSGLYLNGAISQDSRLFWCSNTWWILKDGADDTLSNYEYLGYTIPLKSSHSVTLMAGATHSWQFDQDVDMAAGFYYSFQNWNLYVWGNDFLKAHPRFVIGLDFAL